LSQTALSLALAVFLARLLGAEGFGIYAFCLSVVSLLTVPAMLGGQNLLVREIAAYKTKGEVSFLRGLLHRISHASTSASLILAFCAAGVGLWAYQGSPMQVPFLIAMLLIPLMAAMELQGAALRGLGHILAGQAWQVLLPAMVIVLFGCIVWIGNYPSGPETALFANITGAGLLVVVIHFYFHKRLPTDVKNAEPSYENHKWLKSMLPFVFAGGMQMINREISVILLGIIQGPEDVGLFRVAQRGADLVPFGLIAVNMAIAPTISELFARGEKDRLQQMISKSTWAIMGFALPMGLFLILSGKWLLPVVFGQEYSPSYIILVILCLGQLFNAAMGSVGLLLNMCGFEKHTALGVTIAALISIILNLLLIPLWGTSGSAVATCVSMIAWNILLGIWLYQKTGIKSTFLLRKTLISIII
jgi:O-antigen/teichoic acid export membrane protein